jgi:hypothetical protein
MKPFSLEFAGGLVIMMILIILIFTVMYTTRH